jgi:hypothetical protein
MLKIPAKYDRDTSLAKLRDFFAKLFPASLLGVLFVFARELCG